MIDYQLVVQENHLQKICRYFFPGSDRQPERFAVVFLTMSKSHGMRRFIPAELWLPERNDYQGATGTHLQMSDDFVNRCYTHCYNNGYSFLHIHSHPFDTNKYSFFSGDDDNSDYLNACFFHDLAPNSYFMTGVMSRQKTIIHRLLLVNKKRKCTAKRFSEIRYNSFPLYKEYPKADFGQKNWLQSFVNFDRQVRVFGKEGQDMMAAMRICIVGTGGLGSVLAEILVRLGVRDFILIDHDIAEDTNLNRFPGMYFRDVQKKRPKVHLVRREIRRIQPRARVKAVVREVYEAQSVEAMKQADLIFLCTDNATSRDFVNKFCVQYLTPCISLGSVILFNKKLKKITAILGEIIVILPGAIHNKFCLRCSGAINTDLLKEENLQGKLQERVRGYIHGDQEPAPAVRYINGMVADLAAAEFHNLICSFKPFRRYQQINLMAEKIICDDFFDDDFSNFLQYLQDEKMITNYSEQFRQDILDICTTSDTNNNEKKLRHPLPDGEVDRIIEKHSTCIVEDKREVLHEEIVAYFTPETLSDDPVLNDIHIDSNNIDGCPDCGTMAFRFGQGDHAVLEKFRY